MKGSAQTTRATAAAAAMVAAAALSAGLLIGCGPQHPVAKEETVSSRTPREILRDYTEEWMAVPGVVGTAIGREDGGPALLVMVVEETERIREAIPSKVDGVPVVIKETGQLRALGSE